MLQAHSCSKNGSPQLRGAQSSFIIRMLCLFSCGNYSCTFTGKEGMLCCSVAPLSECFFHCKCSVDITVDIANKVILFDGFMCKYAVKLRSGEGGIFCF